MDINNTKVVLSFSDSNVIITIFNNIGNDINILFQRNINLKEGIIKNGFIVSSLELTNICKKLLRDASLFTELKIKSVYVSIDCNEIFIKPLELEERKLDDGIFDKNVWEKLRKSVTIQQISQKYIYDIDFNSWIIDGKEYTSLDNQIAGDKLVIKANAFQINKVLYNQYINLLEKIDVVPITLKPTLNSFSCLTESINKNQHELFVYVNNSALTIIQTSGRKIVRNIFNDELGLNQLYKVISSAINIDANYIERILNTTAAYGNNIKQLEIINGYDPNDSSIQKVDGKKINSLMAQYAKSIVECAEANVEYLANKKNIKIKKSTYIPSSQLSKMIMNFTQMCTSTNSVIYEDDYIKENGVDKCQTKLLIDSIINDVNNKNHQCVNYLTSKEIKNLKGLNK